MPKANSCLFYICLSSFPPTDYPATSQRELHRAALFQLLFSRRQLYLPLLKLAALDWSIRAAGILDEETLRVDREDHSDVVGRVEGVTDEADGSLDARRLNAYPKASSSVPYFDRNPNHFGSLLSPLSLCVLFSYVVMWTA
jgi:hypothetical protein